ncbi:PH domain-containing protein [Pontibacillus yanchengensis]|uniref:Membrane protein n=1 Tax=Pontibacillus yanchengensis Y32 TaxID=1385514 RepID=A0A0A2TH49_9BACI|nr:PH domain-containing protein [Pontibacillus yanchengensis]KGP73396.1 membrane protein [Pontibacillus yanchengensis Y32]
MEEEIESIPLPKEATSYFRVTYLSELLINLILSTGVAVALYFSAWSIWYAIPLFVITILWIMYRWGWYAEQRRKNVWYQIYEDRIVLHSGVWSKNLVTIPMFRIQHVSIRRGPLLRHYKLSNVTFYTAGSAYDISGMQVDKAQEVKDVVISLAKAREEY